VLLCFFCSCLVFPVLSTFGDCEAGTTEDGCFAECLCGFCSDAVPNDQMQQCVPRYSYFAGHLTQKQTPYPCNSTWKFLTEAQVKGCINADVSRTVKWLSVAILPLLFLVWVAVSYAIYTDSAILHQILGLASLNETNFTLLIVNSFLLIPMTIILVLAIMGHPDAPVLFSRIFIIAVVFNDVKEAIAKAIRNRGLFVWNFFMLGIAQCLLVLPPISPQHSMIFVAAAIVLILVVEALHLFPKMSLLDGLFQKSIFVFSAVLLFAAMGMSVLAGILDKFEIALTIAATICAVAYSSLSTWINEFVAAGVPKVSHMNDDANENEGGKGDLQIQLSESDSSFNN